MELSQEHIKREGNFTNLFSSKAEFFSLVCICKLGPILIPLKMWNKWQRGFSKYTGHTQKNGAVSEVNKKFMSHITGAMYSHSDAENAIFGTQNVSLK